jgi:hypothetical protein
MSHCHKECKDLTQITHIYDNTKRCKCKPNPPVDPCNQPYIVNGNLNVTPPPCLLQSPTYTFLFNKLSEKILTHRFDLLLAAVHNQVSYQRLLTAVRDAQKEGETEVYRYVITNPNGIVVLDTNRPDNVAGDPHSNSYQNYQNGTIDENYNTRPEIMRAQSEQGGVGYNETTELDTILTPKKKVSIRLGPHLRSQGTIRINLRAQDTSFGSPQVITVPDPSFYSSISVDGAGDTFSVVGLQLADTGAYTAIFKKNSNNTFDQAFEVIPFEIASTIVVLYTTISTDGLTFSTAYTTSTTPGDYFSTIYVYNTSDGSQKGTTTFTGSNIDSDIRTQLIVLNDTGDLIAFIGQGQSSIESYSYDETTDIWSPYPTIITDNDILSISMDDSDTLATLQVPSTSSESTLLLIVYTLENNTWTQYGNSVSVTVDSSFILTNLANTIAIISNGNLYYSDKFNNQFLTPLSLDTGGVVVQSVSITGDGNTIVASGLLGNITTSFLYTRSNINEEFATFILLPPPTVVSHFPISISIASSGNTIALQQRNINVYQTGTTTN